MNLDYSEIDHLLYLVRKSGCVDGVKNYGDRSVCDRLETKLMAMADANKIYWQSIEDYDRGRQVLGKGVS